MNKQFKVFFLFIILFASAIYASGQINPPRDETDKRITTRTKELAAKRWLLSTPLLQLGQSKKISGKIELFDHSCGIEKIEDIDILIRVVFKPEDMRLTSTFTTFLDVEHTPNSVFLDQDMTDVTKKYEDKFVANGKIKKDSTFSLTFKSGVDNLFEQSSYYPDIYFFNTPLVKETYRREDDGSFTVRWYSIYSFRIEYQVYFAFPGNFTSNGFCLLQPPNNTYEHQSYNFNFFSNQQEINLGTIPLSAYFIDTGG